MKHPIQKPLLKPKLIGKEHITFRACGPIRTIIANEMEKGETRTSAVQKLIATGAQSKYPDLVHRFNILQEEAA